MCLWVGARGAGGSLDLVREVVQSRWGVQPQLLLWAQKRRPEICLTTILAKPGCVFCVAGALSSPRLGTRPPDPSPVHLAKGPNLGNRGGGRGKAGDELGPASFKTEENKSASCGYCHSGDEVWKTGGKPWVLLQGRDGLTATSAHLCSRLCPCPDLCRDGPHHSSLGKGTRGGKQGPGF